MRKAPNGWLLAGCVVLCGALAGCPTDRGTPVTTTPATTTPGSDAAAKAADEAEHHCDELIASIWDTFKFKNLGISSDLKFGVSLINQWATNCGKKIPNTLNVPEPLLKQLDAELEKEISQERFDRRDGEHLRDSVLFKAIIAYAVGKSETELGRVLSVFQHAVRGVNLIERHPYELPLSPYRMYLLGKGTAADRGWIFAELLRQLKVDAVVLVPDGADQKAEPLESGPLLVGVLLENQVYLFDPRLGLPLLPPGSAGQDPLHTAAATLEQALADPRVFEQFRVDDEHPYVWTPDMLRTARIGLIGNTALWSGRMRRLQSQLIGDRALVVYDGLGDAEDRPGLWSRVTSAKGQSWNPESYFLWTYPESQLTSRTELNRDQRVQMQQLVDHWKIPIPMEFDQQQGKYVFGKPEFEHFKVRLEQVSGNFEQAITGFSSVRLHNNLLPPMPGNPNEKALFAQAAEEAYFQTGVCQLELGLYANSINTFQKFLKSTPAGPWASPARYHLALAYSATGNYPKAIETLEGLSTKSAYYPGCQVLVRHWKAHQKE